MVRSSGSCPGMQLHYTDPPRTSSWRPSWKSIGGTERKVVLAHFCTGRERSRRLSRRNVISYRGLAYSTHLFPLIAWTIIHGGGRAALPVPCTIVNANRSKFLDILKCHLVLLGRGTFEVEKYLVSCCHQNLGQRLPRFLDLTDCPTLEWHRLESQLCLLYKILYKLCYFALWCFSFHSHHLVTMQLATLQLQC